MFEIPNGFLGMQRDIILRLCDLLWQSNKIRLIIGMCLEQFKWRSNSYFQMIKNKNLAFNINSRNPYLIITDAIHWIQCMFTSNWYTIFLDRIILEGIFRWTVQIEVEYSYSQLCLGVTPVVHFRHNSSIPPRINLLSNFTHKRACCVMFEGRGHPSRNKSAMPPSMYALESRMVDARDTWGTLQRVGYSVVKRSADTETYIDTNTEVQAEIKKYNEERRIVWSGMKARTPSESALRAIISAEVDTAAGTLSFFDANAKLKFAYGQLRAPLLMGASGFGFSSVRSLSFCRLPRATPSVVQCTVCEYDES